jgi:hypothetical protein
LTNLKIDWKRFKMQEYFYLPRPIKGKRYNAVLSTYVTWDNEMLKKRYFADPNDRRYVGTFIEDDKFDRDGTLIRIEYGDEGHICFELIEGSVLPALIYSISLAKIDGAIKRVEACCFSGCNNPLIYGGNNASPLMDSGCCDDCNISKVVPARMSLL